VVQLVLYWWLASWWPRVAWDRADAKHLLGYGIPSASIAVFAVAHENLDYLMIGLRMTDDDLGNYVLAFRVPELVIIGICLIVSQVIFPYLSRLQDDREALGKAYLRTLRYLCVITVPAGVLLSLLAPQLVTTLYAQGWGATVDPLRVLALFTVAYAIGFTAGDVFKAVGRPGILNSVAMVKLVVLVPGLWWATGRSITWVAVVLLVSNLAQSALKLEIARRLLNLRMVSTVDALLPSIAASVVMSVIVYLAGMALPPLPAAAELVLLGCAGSVSYLLVLRWLDPGVVQGAVGLLRGSIGRSRRAGKTT
jgi:PST family polysaccharide transporter